VVGIYGMLQPLADGVKLFSKEAVIPNHANLTVFILAPLLSLTLTLLAWGVIPFNTGVVLADISVGVIYIFAISSMGIYAVLMSG